MPIEGHPKRHRQQPARTSSFKRARAPLKSVPSSATLVGVSRNAAKSAKGRQSSDGKIVFRDDDLLARRQSMNEFGKLCLGFFDGDLRHAVILMQVQKSRIALAVFEGRLWRVCESKQPKLTF